MKSDQGWVRFWMMMFVLSLVMASLMGLIGTAWTDLKQRQLRIELKLGIQEPAEKD